jgi:hypothetical protein
VAETGLDRARWEPAPPATAENPRPRRKTTSGSFEIVMVVPVTK